MKPKFHFSRIETEHLFRAWFFISLAFAIMMVKPQQSFLTPITALLSPNFMIILSLSALTAGIGFVFHEMAHKLLAQKYKCFAEFRSNNTMLLFSVLISFTGVLFAAPGAVMINGNIDRKKHGKIAASGPAMNIALAIVFLALMLLIPNPLVRVVSYYGLLINSWLAMFNLLPFPMFDGIKVLEWDKVIYAILMIIAAALMLIQGLLGEAALAGTKFF